MSVAKLLARGLYFYKALKAIMEGKALVIYDSGRKGTEVQALVGRRVSNNLLKLICTTN